MTSVTGCWWGTPGPPRAVRSTSPRAGRCGRARPRRDLPRGVPARGGRRRTPRVGRGLRLLPGRGLRRGGRQRVRRRRGGRRLGPDPRAPRPGPRRDRPRHRGRRRRRRHHGERPARDRPAVGRRRGRGGVGHDEPGAGRRGWPRVDDRLVVPGAVGAELAVRGRPALGSAGPGPVRQRPAVARRPPSGAARRSRGGVAGRGGERGGVDDRAGAGGRRDAGAHRRGRAGRPARRRRIGGRGAPHPDPDRDVWMRSSSRPGSGRGGRACPREPGRSSWSRACCS